ncbi:MAG: energy transducer TonB [Phaeodactylibacter sp.]|nr:energy transducer TonB [Phaeodactylibacter sp.]
MEQVLYRFWNMALGLCLAAPLFGQTTTDTLNIPDGDTIIYKVAHEMPRFPGCERLDTTLAAKYECSQASLLSFIYQNVQYPLAARQEGIEGTVVLTFVVEKDGTISGLHPIKDIGGGCAEEAMRVVGAMNKIGIRWVPGRQDGEVRRVQFNLPVRFKLEDPLPYVMIEGDTVYVDYEEPLAFRNGQEGLAQHLADNLVYPDFAKDSCWVGDMDVSILVQPSGLVKVLDVKDYNNLGFDFQFEAIKAATSTFGMWQPAVYEGRQVPAAYDVNLTFYPNQNACATRIADYDRAIDMADAGLDLFNEGEKEKGIDQMSKAIELFPENANFRYMRGQAFLTENRLEEACADFLVVRAVLNTSYVDDILPLICK